MKEKQESEERARQALVEEADTKLNNQGKEYELKLKEEGARRHGLERIRKELEEQ